MLIKYLWNIAKIKRWQVHSLIVKHCVDIYNYCKTDLAI